MGETVEARNRKGTNPLSKTTTGKKYKISSASKPAKVGRATASFPSFSSIFIRNQKIPLTENPATTPMGIDQLLNDEFFNPIPIHINTRIWIKASQAKS